MKKLTLRKILCATLLVVLILASLPLTAQGTFSVGFIVTDTDYAPIPGVTITLTINGEIYSQKITSDWGGVLFESFTQGYVIATIEPPIGWTLAEGEPSSHSFTSDILAGVYMDITWRLAAAEPPAKEPPFTDVTAAAWYSAYVATVNNLGLMTGTGEGIFSPGGTVTFAQAITTLWRDASEPGATEGGTWYSDAVAWARANGFAINFQPNDPISRQNIAALFAWYANYSDDIDLAPIRDYQEFDDVDDPDVKLLYKAGIINGVGGGRFAPNESTTRAQFAALLTRLLAD